MAQSDRSRRYRARLNQGVAVHRVEVGHDLLHALLDAKRLTPDGALDRREVERAVAEVLTDWTRLWRERNRHA